MDVNIRSEGCNDPQKTPNTCGIAYIRVNGKDHSPRIRGHNVVVLDDATGNIRCAADSIVFNQNKKGHILLCLLVVIVRLGIFCGWVMSYPNRDNRLMFAVTLVFFPDWLLHCMVVWLFLIFNTQLSFHLALLRVRIVY